jgi:hypothetical protein
MDFEGATAVSTDSESGRPLQFSGNCQLCLLRGGALERRQPGPSAVFFSFASYGRSVLQPASLGNGAPAPLVCQTCSVRLSKSWELFTRRVVRPSPVGWSARPVVRYRAWLPRFVASLAWRVLGRVMNEGSMPGPELRQDMLEAREVWRQFALGQLTTPGRFELHMLPIVSLVDGWKQDLYADRAGQMQPIAARTGEAFVWMKLPGVLCLGVLRHGRAGSMLTDTRLAGHPAIWRGPSLHVPGIIRFLMFEELQRSLQKCHDVDGAADSYTPAAGGGSGFA